VSAHPKSGARSDALIPLANLWQRTSKAGKIWLGGRLGLAKVVIVENTKRTSADDPTHVMLLGEPTGGPRPRSSLTAPAPGSAAGYAEVRTANDRDRYVAELAAEFRPDDGEDLLS
jgi:hypothetical protein